MTGLEKILAQIKDEAAKEASDIRAKGEDEAKRIVQEATAEAEAKAARVLAAANAQTADVAQSRESALALQRRQRILAVKQEMLAETLQKALDSLYALPADAYFELLCRLAAANAQPGKGELALNDADKKRLPADFEMKLAAALPKGTALAVCDQTRPIDGGFVLKYGDVEENCSFKAIFSAREDEFSDLARELLFS